MHVFVTGASGWIGSATVPELIGAGHTVTGLARSDASAAAIEAAGAQVARGAIEDLDVLRAEAARADAVIHLAYIHDFSQMQAAADADLRAIEAFGAELKGTDKPFAIASGTLGLTPGRFGTEEDVQDPAAHPRSRNAHATIALAEAGVRAMVVRLAPTVHGEGDAGFVPTAVGIAREKGVSAYVGDGENRWTAVHRLDAARLYRLGIESAPAGSILHAVAEEAIPVKAIAEAIGRGLDVPVESVAPDAAADHFGWLGMFWAMDAPATANVTRELLGWSPEQPGLIEDLDQGHYFR